MKVYIIDCELYKNMSKNTQSSTTKIINENTLSFREVQKHALAVSE